MSFVTVWLVLGLQEEERPPDMEGKGKGKGHPRTGNEGPEREKI